MKKHCLIIAILSILFLPSSVIATTATITSTNLLDGVTDIKSIDEIEYTISDLPASTSGSIKFSVDGTNWKNKSFGTGSETLVTGTNKIPLTNFGTSASFYYQLSLYTPDDSLPLVDSINLNYTTTNNSLFSWNPWVPTSGDTLISSLDSDSSNWVAVSTTVPTPAISDESVLRTEGNGSLKMVSTTDGNNNYLTKAFTSTDLSSINDFQFDIAAESPGTYLYTYLNEGQPGGNGYKLNFTSKNSFSHVNDYSYYKSLSGQSTTIYTDNTIEYDVYLDSIAPSIGGIDIKFTDGTYIRDTGWVDQNGVGCHPGGDLRSYAYKKWFTRVCTVPSSKNGKTINFIDFVNEYDSKSTLTAYYNNFIIRRNNGDIVTLYDGSSSTGYTPSLDFERYSTNTQTLSVVEDSNPSYTNPAYSITIDFSAALGKNSTVEGVENLITDNSDLTFYIDEKQYGSSSIASHLFPGDKVIVKEGTDLAQGTVQSINASTGLVEILSWDSGSTFPVGGFTTAATLFKWQTEYVNLNNLTSTNIDAVTNFIFKINGSSTAKNVYLDNLKYNTGYLSDYASSSFSLPPNNQFVQYRAILTSPDNLSSPSFSDISIGYESNAPDVPTISTASATATSITWTIDDDASAKATSFNIYDLSNVVKATSSGTSSVDITETGLTPNTQYSRKAYGWNGYGRSQKSNEYSQYTLSAVPDLTFVRNDSHATVSAIANNNPSNTKYSIVLNSGTQTDCNLDPDSLTLPDPYYVSQTGSLTTTEANKGWFTSTELSNLVVSGLNNISVYSMCLKSRNEDLIETDYSTAYSNNGNYRPILGDIIVDEGVGNTVGFANYYTDCNDPSRIVFGSDTTDANSNTSRFELRTGVLTLQSNESLIAGELVLGDGSSIAFGEPVATIGGIVNGAQIILGGRITQTDADADGYPEDPSVLCYTTKSNTTLDPTVKLIGQIPNRDVADCDDQSDSLNTVCTTVYLDADRDGKGAGSGTNNCNPDPVTLSCEYGGDQYVTNNTDCNDSESTLSTPLSCYLDSDGDEYGSGTADNYCVETGLSCQGTSTYSAPTNGAAVTTGELSNINTDCYDSSENAYPSSTYCSSTDRGDGSFDYNCSSSETACGTIYSLIQTTANTGGCVGDSCRSYTKTVYSTGSTSCGSTGYGSCTGSTTYCVDCDVNGGVCGCSKSKSFCTSATSGTQACQ